MQVALQIFEINGLLFILIALRSTLKKHTHHRANINMGSYKVKDRGARTPTGCLPTSSPTTELHLLWMSILSVIASVISLARDVLPGWDVRHGTSLCRG